MEAPSLYKLTSSAIQSNLSTDCINDLFGTLFKRVYVCDKFCPTSTIEASVDKRIAPLLKGNYHVDKAKVEAIREFREHPDTAVDTYTLDPRFDCTIVYVLYIRNEPAFASNDPTLIKSRCIRQLATRCRKGSFVKLYKIDGPEKARDGDAVSKVYELKQFIDMF